MMRMNVSPHKAMQSWPGVFCQEPSVEGNLGDISCEVGGGLNAWDRHQNKHQILVCSIIFDAAHLLQIRRTEQSAEHRGGEWKRGCDPAELTAMAKCRGDGCGKANDQLGSARTCNYQSLLLPDVITPASYPHHAPLKPTGVASPAVQQLLKTS